MKKYRTLKKGELVEPGDEVEVSAKYNDDPKWVPANPKSYGTPAPDPCYISHRKYRRAI